MGDLYPKLDRKLFKEYDSDVDVTEDESDSEKPAKQSPAARAPFHRKKQLNESSATEQNKQNVRIELSSVGLDKPQQKLAKNEETFRDKSTLFFVGFMLTILIGVSIGCYFYWDKTASSREDEIQGLDLVKVRNDFEVSLSNLKSLFKNQTKEVWIRIQTVVRMTTSSLQPQSPGVISLIPSESAYETGRCLAKKLATILSGAYKDKKAVVIDGDSIVRRDNDDEIKHDLDKDIRNGLFNNEHVVLLLNFDKIPAKSGMLLHGLCDNDNAPFKQAVFILMVSGNGHPNVDNGGLDAEVTAAWDKDLAKDERMSLEARIGNSIAVVLPETKETLAKIC